jgi:hypothetical protein
MRGKRRRPGWAGALLALATSITATPAAAVVLSEDELEDESQAIGVVARYFGFLLTGDVLAPPYNPVDQNPQALGIFDSRLYYEQRTSAWKLVVHNQLTLRMQTHASLSPLSLGRGLSPPRWLPLDFRHNDDTLRLRSNGDWLYTSLRIDPVTVTVGRQPVTFGRGTLWRTTDRISTFALTEVDTEFKPGADMLRLDAEVADQTQLTLLAAVGELESNDKDFEAELGGSSFLARLTHGWQGGELGVSAGFVRYDAMLGIDAVLDFGEFDVYGELTGTRISERSLSTPTVDDERVPVPSALLGMTLRPVPKLTLKPEAHYNGFGSFDSDDYLAIALSQRVGIGEQTTLGRVYLGNTTDVELHPLTHLFSSMIVNANDPSALLSLGVAHNLAENVDLIAGGYLPMGPLPSVERLAVRSEFGSYPIFLFTELKGTI